MEQLAYNLNHHLLGEEERGARENPIDCHSHSVCIQRARE